jgi:putative ABC transport system substrate-binding protein
MKTLRQVIVLTLAAATVCTASACSTSKSDGGTEKTYKIGVTQYQDHPSLDNCRTGFIDGLMSEGFEAGKNLNIEFKSAQGDSAMNTQIAQSFSNGKDLVCGIATPSAQALYASCAEKNIPVIFNAVSDPVAAKLAVSETEAMKGVSGISDRLPVDAQLKLIRDMLPEAKKIGILYTTSEANSISTLETYKSLASQYGFEIVEKGITKQAEMPQAVDSLLNGVDCVSNMTDNTVVAALSVLLEKADAKKIPVFGSEEEQVKNGCVASAGLDYIALGKQAGIMAAKVLKGQDVSTLPYETIKESKITLNTAKAAALGITVPDSVASAAESVQ